MSLRKLFLCYQASDEQEIVMAQRYWALSNEGKWVENVATVAEEFGLSKYELPARVQSATSAHDLGSRCFWCRSPEPISTRASLTSIYSRKSGYKRYEEPRGAQLCPACEIKNQRRHAEAKQQESLKRQEAISQALTQAAQCQVRVKVDEISLTDAASFLALLFAADMAEDENGTEVFTLNGVLSGSERVDAEICGRLFTIGAITPSAKADIKAYELHDNGKISFAWPHVPWELGPSIKGIPYLGLCDQLSMLLDGTPATPAGTEKMWFQVASAECETVLLDQLETYYLGEYTVGEKTLQAFHYALEKLSIPQVWGIIYSVTKHAASLKQSRTYSALHIRNMIPKMIISFVDRAFDNNWAVYARTRKEYHVEGFLTSVFFSRVLRQSTDSFRSATSTSIRQRSSFNNSDEASPTYN